MLSFYNDIFIGLYRFIANADGCSPDEISLSSTISAIFGLVFLEVLIAAGAILYFSEHMQFFKNSRDGIIAVGLLFIANFVYLIYKNRYVNILSRYLSNIEDRRSIVVFRTKLFVAFVFIQFVVLVIVTIISM